MKWLWIAPLVAGSYVHAAEVRVRFADVKSLVETRNERVQAFNRDAAAAKTREGHLARSFLPQIQAYYASETFETGTQPRKYQPDYGAEATVNIFNGGRDRLKEKTLNARAERKSVEARVSTSIELTRARELYWRITYQQNLLALLKDMAQINEANLKAARKRIRSGVATESDRLEFEMQAIELRRDVSQAEIGIRSASRDLLVLLGFTPTDTLKIEGELDHNDDWERDIRHAHKDHEYLVKPAVLMSEEAELTARGAARSWVPRLDAYAGWNQYNQREEDPAGARDRQESVLGLRLRVSLFDGLSAQREAEALRQEAAAARLVANYQGKLNEAEIESEFDELRFLHDRVHEADENIKSAQNYYRITQSEYARGVKNSPDVMGASAKLFAMKSKRLEMIRDFQIARSHVLSKIGK